MKNKHLLFGYTSATPKKLFDTKKEAKTWVEQERDKRGMYKNEFNILKIKVA